MRSRERRLTTQWRRRWMEASRKGWRTGRRIERVAEIKEEWMEESMEFRK